MPKVSKRTGLTAMLAIVAVIVGTATFAAVAAGEPEKLDCSGEWGSIGFVEAANSYKTPQEAATAFLSDGDPKQLPADVDLVELAKSEASAQFAARIDGRTDKVISLAESDGAWTVEGFQSC